MKEILELSGQQFTITLRNMLWTLMEKVDNMKQYMGNNRKIET